MTQDQEAPVLTTEPRERSRPLSEYGLADFYASADEGTDPFDILEPFAEWWQYALERGWYMYGMPMKSAPASRVVVHSPNKAQATTNLINFASYNYLGLSYRPEVIDATTKAMGRYGLGSESAPLLAGMSDLHELLASDLADFMARESVLLLPTGYGANLGAIAGLMRPGDTIVADQLAHASIVDGIRLAGIRPRFFRHNDADDLERKLRRSTGRKLVVAEGVYSMEGDIGALNDIVSVCRRHGARILVDEAHSVFVYGNNGRGVAEHLGVYEEVDIVVGTTSKTLGGIGGFVAGPLNLIKYLRLYARTHMFSGALPPAVVAGLIEALAIVRNEPQLRARLWRNVALMRQRLHEGGVDTGRSTSQVIPIMIRDDDIVPVTIAEELFDAGVYIHPILYPAVARNQSRLRMSVTAGHSEEEIEEGARLVISVLDKYGKCSRAIMN